MKIALVHDYIKEYGGAERVLTALHEIFPDAPLYTSVYLPEYLGPHKDKFKGWDIRTSFLQKIPFKAKLISPFRIISPLFFENINLTEYDVVIVSATGAYFPNLLMTRPDAMHICYCHTPPRYLYGYPTARKWSENKFIRLLSELFNSSLRITDFVSSKRPDYFIVNSEETRGRVKKFYRRDSTLIYPPVELVDETSSKAKTQSVKLRNKTNKYFVTGGRLARAKRVDLLIKACNKLKVPLKIFGRSFAGYEEELKAISGPTIEFIGEVTDKETISLYQDAKAFLFAGEAEDFGIMPVEAQACGTPVIGPNFAGVKETVVNGSTGVLFGSYDVESVVSAINKLNTLSIKPEDCIENAKRFSKNRFQKEILDFIKKRFTPM